MIGDCLEVYLKLMDEGNMLGVMFKEVNVEIKFKDIVVFGKMIWRKNKRVRLLFMDVSIGFLLFVKSVIFLLDSKFGLGM